jgi:hypothetical protein
MEITATGFCEECDEEVLIDFDDENGAPFCADCNSYEVRQVITDTSDDFDDDFVDDDLDPILVGSDDDEDDEDEDEL